MITINTLARPLTQTMGPESLVTHLSDASIALMMTGSAHMPRLPKQVLVSELSMVSKRSFAMRAIHQAQASLCCMAFPVHLTNTAI